MVAKRKKTSKGRISHAKLGNDFSPGSLLFDKAFNFFEKDLKFSCYFAKRSIISQMVKDISLKHTQFFRKRSNLRRKSQKSRA